MRKVKPKYGVLLALIFLIGCTDTRVIEKTGFIRSIAYDAASSKDDDNLLKLTIAIPKSNVKEVLLYTTTAKSSKEARKIFDRQNNRKIVNGQLRQVLFGEKMARRGVWSHIDTLVRDPSIGNRVHVLVVEGDAEKLLSRKLPQGSGVGEYIDDLIRTEAKFNEIPNSNLYTFIRDYYDDGIDPVAPLIKESKNSLILDGIALFRKDQYVAKIKPGDMIYFAFLGDSSMNSGDLNMDLNSKGGQSEEVALLFISSRRKVNIVSGDTFLHGEKLKVSIDVSVKGSLLEYSGALNLNNDSDQKKLESAMSLKIQEKCQSLITIMQKNKVDPIGIGQYARNLIPYKEWVKLPWENILSEADITVHAHVEIKDYGRLQQ
jgi:spore germination protein